jgi:hypothetical protein
MTMKASEYRRRLENQLEAAAPERPSRQQADSAERREPTVDDILTELTNRRLGTKRRVAAVALAGPRAVKRARLMNALINVVADATENDEVRKAALAAVEAATFKTVEFRRYAARYTEALRVAATDDDPELRLQALDILALNRDAYAQQLLAAGLRDRREAVVSPLQAIRMLGYDLHAEHYPLLRELVDTTRNAPLRRAALGLLAADSASRPLMQRILTDKSEDRGARTTAAVALQSLAPKEFARAARRIVLDDDDATDVRAAVISAMSQSPAPPARDVVKKVREIDESPGGARQLNRAVQRFRAVQHRRSQP